MSTASPIVVVANTRLPSQRAQALQVAQMSAAFARTGAETHVLYAKRRPSVSLPPGVDVFDWYAVPKGARPTLVPIPCVDWIERVPRLLQYVPARLQEQSFARNAAREVVKRFGDARIYAREIEVAAQLARAGLERVYLEIHRVPGSRSRRRMLIGAADSVKGIVAISKGVETDLLALGVDRTLVAVEHDAFELARFEHLPTKLGARATLGLPADVPLVVYTGGLLAWKGVDVLVEAAKLSPETYFVIAGGMEVDVQRLRHKVGGVANVRVDGFQAPERVSLYLAAGDVGVVPNRSKPAISARYTSPLKVFESMAAGLPLVVSDVPSLREILTPDEEAVFVAPDDASALRVGIAALLSDTSRREALAKRARLRAPRHTWDARAQRIVRWMEMRESSGRSPRAL